MGWKTGTKTNKGEKDGRYRGEINRSVYGSRIEIEEDSPSGCRRRKVRTPRDVDEEELKGRTCDSRPEWNARQTNAPRPTGAAGSKRDVKRAAAVTVICAGWWRFVRTRRRRHVFMDVAIRTRWIRVAYARRTNVDGRTLVELMVV